MPQTENLPATSVDHGGLDGLADDDHPQYHNDARAVTWHDSDDHSALLGKYDSGWFVIPTVNTATTKTHNLGTTNVIAELYGATDSGGSNMGKMAILESPGGTWLQNITTTQVDVRSSNADMGYVWNGSSYVQATHVRIIIMSLE